MATLKIDNKEYGLDILYTFDGYGNITRCTFKLKFFGSRFSSAGRATAL